MMKNLTVSLDISGKADATPNLWKALRTKGWEIDNRLYLGFGAKRVQFSILEQSGDNGLGVKIHEKSQ